MDKLTRNQCSYIFQGRTRMLKIKENYKTANRDLTCRMCSKTQETQKHILEECEIIHTTETNKIQKEELFSEDISHLRTVAQKIENIMELMERNT